MHPLITIPIALLGFLFGRLSTKNAKPNANSGSPLDDVTLGAWEKFVGAMAVAPRNHVGRRGKLGTFQMDARRLADVGAMTRAWKERRGGEEGVWVGDWLEGLTEVSFLGSMPLQYAVFTRSCRAAAPKVSGFCGREVDGRVASLSGLLGVCHVAGERGVGSFVVDESTRERFPATREVFTKVNGIF
jgi:hypothetical protein